MARLSELLYEDGSRKVAETTRSEVAIERRASMRNQPTDC